MVSRLDKIYAASPVWVQQVGISAFGLMWKHRRFGGQFHHAATAFKNRETYSTEQWREYQTSQLRRVLIHANRFVPYYREAFAQAKLVEADLAGFEIADLSRLPLLTKEAMRRQPNACIAENAGKLHPYTTSGTTGTPLTIKFSSETQRTWAAAYETRCRYWAGVNHKMSRAMIGGRLVVPRAEAKPPFWRYNYAERQLYMSAFHISPTNAPHYVAALNHYRPDYLVGYASSHYFLARMIQELKLKVYQPRAVLTSSEKLTDEMRATIEGVYDCRVFDGYSGVEACCLASECEYGRLHVSPDVGFVELIDEHGNQVADGQAGEIVATGFLNLDQPLIRYRSGDQAIFSRQSCECRRAMPVLKELIGRLEDVVIGLDGSETVRFHGIFVGLPHVREGQVIQETLADFRVRLAIEPEFNEQDRQVIRQRFNERLGAVNVKFDVVDSIERTERGKFRAVISHLTRQSASINHP